MFNISGAHKAKKSRHVVRLEELEPRLLLAADFEFRTIDGTDNNSDDPDLGAANTNLIRIAEADYPGVGSGKKIVNEFLKVPAGRANPRDISNAIADQADQIVLNDRYLSDFVWQWGQFVDHDIDLTGTSSDNGTADIPINDDADPLGPNPIPFDRSDFDPQTGRNKHNPRQQLNQITSFIDASNVYGSDETRAAALRTFVGGKLATSKGDLLPFNTQGLPNAGGPSPELFLAGDVRANEQVALTAMHTLFVREHNRLADLLAPRMQDASDEEIYQMARKIVGAEMQIITYNEFLPALLGEKAPKASEAKYSDTVDPSVGNEFSTAFYRFGHSMLSPDLLLVGGSDNHTLPLRDAFFNPDFLAGNKQNVERLLRGLASQTSQEIDTLLVDDVRNFLFGEPGAGGLDLASLNIQRGRDHGIPDYNSLRVAYGLSAKTSFHDPGDGSGISSDQNVADKLAVAYDNDIDNIDAWVGGLAEDHEPDSSVGELVRTALVDQFVRLRDGDRFFYFKDRELEHSAVTAVIDLDQVTLANIIQWNTTINKHLPANVFLVSNSGSSAASLTGAEATQSDAATTIQLALLPTGQEPSSQSPAQNGDDHQTGQQPAGEGFASDSASENSVSTQVVDPLLEIYVDPTVDRSEVADVGTLNALFGSLDAGWWHEDLLAGLLDPLASHL